jgi:hypothetical protein
MSENIICMATTRTYVYLWNLDTCENMDYLYDISYYEAIFINDAENAQYN